ncbi:MAG: phycobilisome protein [Synechococcales cyanobacterium CRU_2_2]|nr:phycobilisome protein [Synechococcales cyanobacterium CRU_2_2]
MLSQTKALLQTAEGRYATDAELQFLEDYAQSFPARLKAYQALRQQERSLIQKTYAHLRAHHPELLSTGAQDKEAVRKWQRDTVFVLRFSALAMLLDDGEALRDRLMLWFQTIMRAFGMQKVCYHTYATLKSVTLELIPEGGDLIAQVLEENRELFDLPDVVNTP